MPIYKTSGKKDGKTKYRVRLSFQDKKTGKYKQIERTVYGLDEAKNVEMKLRNDLFFESTNSTTTIQDLYEEYIKSKQHEVREITIRKTKGTLTEHILPILGTVRIKNLNTPLLQKWKQTIEDKNLSFVTRKNIYGEFRTMLNYAVKMDYIQINPLLKVGNFKAPLELKKEMQYYTVDEFKKFKEAAKQAAVQAENDGTTYEWNFYVFFCIAFYTGLRKGEIHGLQWDDIIDDCFLSIKRSINQKVKGEDRVTPPKNKSSIRTIQIPKPLIEILDEHRARCQKLDGFNDTYKICGGTKPLRDTSIELRNAKYAKLANVKKIRIHDFRHSHASLLANEGINIQEVARRLGHSKIEITWNVYSHLYPREEERAMKILNEIV